MRNQTISNLFRIERIKHIVAIVICSKFAELRKKNLILMSFRILRTLKHHFITIKHNTLTVVD